MKKTINASIYGTGGTIKPSGDIQVTNGRNKQFIISPDKGYLISSIKVDGTDIRDCNIESKFRYLFYNVTSDHKVVCAFEKKES